MNKAPGSVCNQTGNGLVQCFPPIFALRISLHLNKICTPPKGRKNVHVPFFAEYLFRNLWWPSVGFARFVINISHKMLIILSGPSYPPSQASLFELRDAGAAVLVEWLSPGQYCKGHLFVYQFTFVCNIVNLIKCIVCE